MVRLGRKSESLVSARAASNVIAGVKVQVFRLKEAAVPLTGKSSSEKSVFIRLLLVFVLLAASLVAPVALPSDGVSALGGEQSEGGGGGSSS